MLRAGRYSHLTEGVYIAWIRRLIELHRERDPAEMGGDEVGAYVTYLADERKVAPPTQNQALNAPHFFYRRVLGMKLAWSNDIVRAKKSARLPVVLSMDEVQAVLAGLQGSRYSCNDDCLARQYVVPAFLPERGP